MKRRALILLCCLALLPAALTGCAPAAIPAPTNTGRRAAPAAEAAQPADGYALTVGDAALKPPMALYDLESLGFAVDAPEGLSLPPLAVSDPLNVAGRGTSFIGRLYNPTEEPQPWRDCWLASIRIHGAGTAEGGVAVGMGRGSVQAAFGEVDEGMEDKTSCWMLYGTWLYYGLGFEIDNKTQRVLSIVSFCVPSGAAEEKLP